MKKNILLCISLFVVNTTISMHHFSLLNTLSITGMISNGKATIGDKTFHLCITKDLESMQQKTPHFKDLEIAQRAQRENELCVKKFGGSYIMPQKKERILSITDFKGHVTAAILAQHNDQTWYAALSCCPNYEYRSHIHELMNRMNDVVKTYKSINLIRFITIAKKTPENIVYCRTLHEAVKYVMNTIKKPLQIWSFDYNEEKSVPFSQEIPKDVEIYLNPDGTGFLYLNTTNEYIPLP